MLSINSAASLLEFLLREEYILVDYGVVLAKHQLPRSVLDVLLPDVGEASAGRGDQLEKHLRLNYEVSFSDKERGSKIRDNTPVPQSTPHERVSHILTFFFFAICGLINLILFKEIIA